MSKFLEIYKILNKKYGNLNWWPTISRNKRFEIIIGAILTQNTSWKNVEKAILNLHKKNLIDVRKISKTSQRNLAKLIKPAGYYNQKAERLKIFANHIIKNPDFLKKKTPELREELLTIKGIGPETADSILLYALHRPVFVIDAYTKRIFSRIGMPETGNYDELQQIFSENLPRSAKLFNNYHAVLVEHAKNHCKTKPLCNGCILNRICKLNSRSICHNARLP